MILNFSQINFTIRDKALLGIAHASRLALRDRNLRYFVDATVGEKSNRQSMNNHNHSSSDRLSNSLNYPIWQRSDVIRWSQIMADSYRQLLGQNLIEIESDNTSEQLATALFHAPFVLVSHNNQANPIYNYANQTALQLWSLSWDEFTQTPSAATTEPDGRSDRQIMLQQAQQKGYIDNYQGIRISGNGQKFRIEQVKLWNLTDESGNRCGQAATFPSWTWL